MISIFFLTIVTVSLLVTIVARRHYPVLLDIPQECPNLKAKLIAKGSLTARPICLMGLTACVLGLLGAFYSDLGIPFAQWLALLLMVGPGCAVIYAAFNLPITDSRADYPKGRRRDVVKGDKYALQYLVAFGLLVLLGIYLSLGDTL